MFLSLLGCCVYGIHRQKMRCGSVISPPEPETAHCIFNSVDLLFFKVMFKSNLDVFLCHLGQNVDHPNKNLHLRSTSASCSVWTGISSDVGAAYTLLMSEECVLCSSHLSLSLFVLFALLSWLKQRHTGALMSSSPPQISFSREAPASTASEPALICSL